jgi:hypothetical protein
MNLPNIPNKKANNNMTTRPAPELDLTNAREAFADVCQAIAQLLVALSVAAQPGRDHSIKTTGQLPNSDKIIRRIAATSIDYSSTIFDHLVALKALPNMTTKDTHESDNK